MKMTKRNKEPNIALEYARQCFHSNKVFFNMKFMAINGTPCSYLDADIIFNFSKNMQKS